MSDPRRATSFHEAGHAVAIVCLGARVTRLAIFAADYGKTSWVKGTAELPSEHAASIALAGLVAEWILEGRPVKDWAAEALPVIRSYSNHHSFEDVSIFDDALTKCGRSEEEAIETAERLLRAEWAAVERLAERLVARMGDGARFEILGEEAHEFVSGAIREGESR